MTLKEATANSLLMFVAATCVVLIVRAMPQTQSTPPTAAGLRTADAGSTIAPLHDGVIVYYLHSNTRCPTCRTIEAFAEEAVYSDFAEELKRGKIQWHVVNYEEPGNEHFAKDYEVVAPNVVLVKLKAGQQVAWKGLPEVWEHVGDKAAFLDFVQMNLREFLQEVDGGTSNAELPLPPSADSSADSLPIPK